MAITLSYAPGESCRIFSPNSTWGPGGFSTGTVLRVTPSGQIVVKAGDRERRFTPTGKEVGGQHTGWHPTGLFILPQAESEARAHEIVRHIARQRLTADTKKELERLSRLDPCCEQADLIAGLRALANWLAQEGAP